MSASPIKNPTSAAGTFSQAGIVVIGDGLVGLATAYALRQRDAKVKITLIEKEAELGASVESQFRGASLWALLQARFV